MALACNRSCGSAARTCVDFRSFLSCAELSRLSCDCGGCCIDRDDTLTPLDTGGGVNPVWYLLCAVLGSSTFLLFLLLYRRRTSELTERSSRDGSRGTADQEQKTNTAATRGVPQHEQMMAWPDVNQTSAYSVPAECHLQPIQSGVEMGMPWSPLQQRRGSCATKLRSSAMARNSTMECGPQQMARSRFMPRTRIEDRNRLSMPLSCSLS